MSTLRICMNRKAFIALDDMRWLAQRSAWAAHYRETGEFHPGRAG